MIQGASMRRRFTALLSTLLQSPVDAWIGVAIAMAIRLTLATIEG